MSLSRRWIWALVVAALILLILPIPIAERYSSPTQDGQYATNPIRAYRFVFAAARVSPSSELNTSGEALDRAKAVFRDSAYQPTKVELLFLPGDEEYQYTTRDGRTMRFQEEGSFVWEVWGELAEGQAPTEPASPAPTAGGDGRPAAQAPRRQPSRGGPRKARTPPVQPRARRRAQLTGRPGARPRRPTAPT